MTKIQIRKVNGVPMGRPINPFSKEHVAKQYTDYMLSQKYDAFERTATEHPAPGFEEGEAEGELIYQMYDDNDGYEEWLDTDTPDRDRANGYTMRKIWRIVPTPEKVEVKEVLTVEQIVDEVILQTLNDLYFLGQLRESESHIVRNQLIAERKKKILDKLSPPAH